MIAESDEEEDNSEGEVDMKSIMKSLALITREYNRVFKRPSYRSQYEREDRGRSYDKRTEEKREEREARRDDQRSHHRGDGRGGERSENKGEKNDGCFKCGKPGHYASECYSKDSRPKPQKDVAYYKKRAEYYTQRSLLAEKDDLQTDESSADEANNPSFCGMASIDSPNSDQEVSTSYNSNETESLFSKLDRKLTFFYSVHSELLKKLTFLRKRK